MKRLNLYLVILLTLSFFVGLFYGLYRNRNQVDDGSFTAFSLNDFSSTNLLTEEPVSFTTLGLNKPVLLNVWGSWCISCRIEHPYLLKLAEQGITIIGINYLDDKTKATEWLKALGNPYKVSLFDNTGKLGADLGVIGAPETYVVSAQGKVLARYRGVLNQEVFTQKLEPFLMESDHSHHHAH